MSFTPLRAVPARSLPRRPLASGLALLALLGSTAGAQIAQVARPGSVRNPVPACPEFWVDVTAHGAVPGDGADDTQAIQAAVDQAMAGGGGSVVFPPGVFDVGQVEIGGGLRLFGHGATLRKLPDEPEFSRTFTTTGKYRHDAATDSAPLVIEGFTFDGNRLQQGPYLASEKEHQAAVFLHAHDAQPGRLVATVRDCRFHDGTADGVAVYTNANVSITRCTGSDLFRGLVSVGGGHSIVHLTDLNGGGAVHPAGIDFEIDGAGWGGSLAVDATLDGLVLGGRFDLGLGPGSRVVANNVLGNGAQFVVYARDSRVSLSNSRFTVGPSGPANRLIYPNDVSITGCTFLATEPDAAEADREFRILDVAWEVTGSANSGPQNLRIQDCRFLTDGTLEPTDTVYGLYSGATLTAAQNRLEVRGVQIGGAVDRAFWIQQGGIVHFSESSLDGATALGLHSSPGRDLDVTLDALEFGPSVQDLLQFTGGPNADVIRHRGITLDESLDNLKSLFGLGTTDFRGSRTILGAGPPAGAPGILGDVWRLKAPIAGAAYEWVCTASGELTATWTVKTIL